MKTWFWFPTTVTQACLPSDFNVTFILVSPDSASFWAQSRDSNISPSLSFRFETLILYLKFSVNIVPFSPTLNLNTLPPSTRNAEPVFDSIVTQPSSESVSVLARMRKVCTNRALQHLDSFSWQHPSEGLPFHAHLGGDGGGLHDLHVLSQKLEEICSADIAVRILLDALEDYIELLLPRPL